MSVRDFSTMESDMADSCCRSSLRLISVGPVLTLIPYCYVFVIYIFVNLVLHYVHYVPALNVQRGDTVH